MQAPYFSLVGWISSEAFKGLEMPCGCKALDDAEHIADEDAREVMREQARRAQCGWGCPDVTKEIPKGHLPVIEGDSDREAAIVSVEQVRVMTGFKPSTCPWWYTARPEVLAAARVHRWREHGGVNLDECDNDVVQALDAIDSGIGASIAYQRRIDQQKKDAGG